MKPLILLSFLIGISTGQNKFGKKCSDDSDCLETNQPERDKSCVDNVCVCQPGSEVTYSGYGLIAYCTIPKNRPECSPGSCGPNAKCKSFHESGGIGIRDKNLCYCDEGFMYVDSNTCVNGTHQGLLERCYKSSNGEVRSCDLSKKSYCSVGRCICFDNYFANTTSGECEPMKNYLKAYNLTSYQVRPGEYCTEASQCIPGLQCKSFKCACPLPCTYNSKKMICDCGTDTPTGPIVVGVLLGLVILVFWVMMIRWTYVRVVKKRQAAKFDNVAQSSESSPSHSIALNDMTPNTVSSGVPTAPLGLSVPAANGGEGGQTLPYKADESLSPASNHTLPYKVGGDTTCPFPPPIDGSTTIPPYPANTTDTASSLPYSVSPTSPPYNPTSSYTPYSHNPSDSSPSAPSAPYSHKPSDSSPSYTPYSHKPSDSSPSYTPYSHKPSDSSPSYTPYSHKPSDSSPSAAPYSESSYKAPFTVSKPEMDDNVAPPAYNPSYP